jgi:hypothetical protein
LAALATAQVRAVLRYCGVGVGVGVGVGAGVSGGVGAPLNQPTYAITSNIRIRPTTPYQRRLSLKSIQGNWQINLDSRGDLAFGDCRATIDAAGVLSANCDQIGDAGGLDTLTATLQVQRKTCRVTNVGGPFQYFDHHVGSAALLILNAWLSIDRDAINGVVKPAAEAPDKGILL